MAERPEDLNLPNTVISRIIKESLPDGVIITKEARMAISKAASVFILYASSTANSYATDAKRKTLTANDVLCAIEEMGFESFLEPLKSSLEAFRAKKNSKKLNTPPQHRHDQNQQPSENYPSTSENQNIDVSK